VKFPAGKQLTAAIGMFYWILSKLDLSRADLDNYL
jgi:hypothetical protein